MRVQLHPVLVKVLIVALKVPLMEIRKYKIKASFNNIKKFIVVAFIFHQSLFVDQELYLQLLDSIPFVGWKMKTHSQGLVHESQEGKLEFIKFINLIKILTIQKLFTYLIFLKIQKILLNVLYLFITLLTCKIWYMQILKK